jgi:hypothetical protein
VEDLSTKIRFTVLWVLGMIGFFIYRTMAVNQDAYNVSLTSTRELITILAVMLLFALLSLFTSFKINRQINIIAGIVFLVIEIIMIVDGLTSYPKEWFNLPTGAVIVLMAAVIWFAVRWGKQKA